MRDATRHGCGMEWDKEDMEDVRMCSAGEAAAGTGVPSFCLALLFLARGLQVYSTSNSVCSVFIGSSPDLIYPNDSGMQSHLTHPIDFAQ